MKFRSLFKNLIMHLQVILAVPLITLWILDSLNPNMSFLTNTVAKALLITLFVVSLISGGLQIYVKSNVKEESAKKNRPVEDRKISHEFTEQTGLY